MSWSSVTAFLAAAQGGSDAKAEAVLGAITTDLDPDARLVVDAQRQPTARRLEWVEARSARRWTAAELSHVEGMAFVAIRRRLQRSGLYASDLRAAASPR